MLLTLWDTALAATVRRIVIGAAGTAKGHNRRQCTGLSRFFGGEPICWRNHGGHYPGWLA